MKAVVSLLVALFALTGSIGARGALGPCGAVAITCAKKPCCQTPQEDLPALRAKMACCDVARTVEVQPTPAVSSDHSALELVAVVTTPTTLLPAPPTRIAPTAPPLSPRGPPIYLRHRSLLL